MGSAVNFTPTLDWGGSALCRLLFTGNLRSSAFSRCGEQSRKGLKDMGQVVSISAPFDTSAFTQPK